MRVVVDANIVFSAILNADGKIGDLLINSVGIFRFIAPDFLRSEIRSHYDKLVKISKMPLDDILEAEYQICQLITFISEEQISAECWRTAADLAAGIDEKDTVYIAYAKQFKCKLWTGDKRLQKGLAGKKVRDALTTNDLFLLREQRLSSKL